MTSSATNQIIGPWIPSENIPSVRRSFDMSRDPMIKEQILDMEAQQRGEQSGGGTSTTKQDRPELLLRPPPEMRFDAASFQQGWLAGQRDAAMAQAKAQPSQQERSPEYKPAPHQPTR